MQIKETAYSEAALTCSAAQQLKKGASIDDAVAAILDIAKKKGVTQIQTSTGRVVLDENYVRNLVMSQFQKPLEAVIYNAKGVTGIFHDSAKLKVDKTTLENAVAAEVARGKIKTYDDLADFIIKQLPKGAERKAAQSIFNDAGFKTAAEGFINDFGTSTANYRNLVSISSDLSRGLDALGQDLVKTAKGATEYVGYYLSTKTARTFGIILLTAAVAAGGAYLGSKWGGSDGATPMNSIPVKTELSAEQQINSAIDQLPVDNTGRNGYTSKQIKQLKEDFNEDLRNEHGTLEQILKAIEKY